MVTIFSSSGCTSKIFDSLVSLKLLPVFALALTTMPIMSKAMFSDDQVEKKNRGCQVRLPSAITREKQKIHGIYAVHEGEEFLLFNADNNGGIKLGIQFQVSSKLECSFNEKNDLVVKHSFYQGFPYIRAIGFSDKIEQALERVSLKPGDEIIVIVKPHHENRNKDKVTAFAPEDIHVNEVAAAIKANSYSSFFRTDGSFDLEELQRNRFLDCFFPHELLDMPYNCTREDIIRSGFTANELLESGFTDNEITPHFAKESLKVWENLICQGFPKENLKTTRQNVLKDCIRSQLTNNQLFDLGFTMTEIIEERIAQNLVNSDRIMVDELDTFLYECDTPFDDLEKNIFEILNSSNSKENIHTISVKHNKKKINMDGVHHSLLNKNVRKKPSRTLQVKLFNAPLKDINRRNHIN